MAQITLTMSIDTGEYPSDTANAELHAAISQMAEFRNWQVVISNDDGANDYESAFHKIVDILNRPKYHPWDIDDYSDQLEDIRQVISEATGNV